MTISKQIQYPVAGSKSNLITESPLVDAISRGSISRWHLAPKDSNASTRKWRSNSSKLPPLGKRISPKVPESGSAPGPARGFLVARFLSGWMTVTPLDVPMMIVLGGSPSSHRNLSGASHQSLPMLFSGLRSVCNERVWTNSAETERMSFCLAIHCFRGAKSNASAGALAKRTLPESSTARTIKRIPLPKLPEHVRQQTIGLPADKPRQKVVTPTVSGRVVRAESDEQGV